jgi:hypothetical protein
MKKSRPGIFDPWRQEAPTRDEAATDPKHALRVEDALEPVQDQEEICAVFPGYRTRLHVWLDADCETPMETARSRIVALVHTLAKGHRSAFEQAGVFLAGLDESGPHATIHGKENSFVRIRATDDKAAVDTLVGVLRELQNKPDGEKAIAAARIKALIV